MVSGRLRCLSLLFNGSADTTLRAPQRPCRSLSAIFHNPSHHESSTSTWPVATTSRDLCGFLRGTAALTDSHHCTTYVDSVLLASSDTLIPTYSVLIRSERRRVFPSAPPMQRSSPCRKVQLSTN